MLRRVNLRPATKIFACRRLGYCVRCEGEENPNHKQKQFCRFENLCVPCMTAWRILHYPCDWYSVLSYPRPSVASHEERSTLKFLIQRELLTVQCCKTNLYWDSISGNFQYIYVYSFWFPGLIMNMGHTR